MNKTVYMKIVRLFIIFLAINSTACAPPVKDTMAEDVAVRKTIYLVSHGWHAGIVLQRVDIANSIWPDLDGFPDTHYLEIGWGDLNFYQTPDPHFGIYLKAVLLPTASVLHVVGFNNALSVNFPHSEIIRIELSTAGFEQLTRTLAASFVRDADGKSTSLGPGLYGNSRFYPSNERYHIFNTCNVWTARALRDAGMPISPSRSISVERLMSQVRTFGMQVQSVPKSSP